MELTEYLKKIKGSEGYRIFLTGLNKQFKSAGVSLTREDELNRTLRVVHDLRETLQVGEEEVSTLVCGEATAEADVEGVRCDALEESNHT